LRRTVVFYLVFPTQRALTRDNYAPIVRYMALFALKRYEETVAVCQATAASHPNHAGAWRLMTVSLGLLGRIDEASEALAHDVLATTRQTAPDRAIGF
jgi:predicted Zn-dependent protease